MIEDEKLSRILEVLGKVYGINFLYDEQVRTDKKLSVNYVDPKFMRMSEDAREEKINDAFQASVRALAKLDEAQEELDGFWYRLVELTDQGKKTGLDAKTLTSEQLKVVLEKVLPDELVARGVEQAASVCSGLVSDLKGFHGTATGSADASPEAVFKRIGGG